MDADDASIKKQLLTVRNDLIDAYENGPEELVSFMKSWNALKDRIVAGASAHLLSIETLQLAAEVARPVAAIAASLLNLNAVGAKLGAELIEETTRQVLLHRQSLDDSQQPEDEDSDSPPYSEYLSDSEGDDDELEDPDAPKYYLLRDWFFANIGHPFFDPAQDYEDLLKEANVDRDEFFKWLEFVRTRSGWHRIFQKHARSSAHWMEKLCEQVFDELDCEVPRRKSAVPLIIRDDFRTFRLQVDQIYHPNLAMWWGDVNQLLAEAGYERWSDPIDDLDWHSNDYVSSNEDIEDSDSDSESDNFGSASSIAKRSKDAEPHTPISFAVANAASSINIIGTKRKAVELEVDFSCPLSFISATREQNTSHQSCKRRKLQHLGTPDREPTLTLYRGSSISSAPSPADSLSSHASSSPPLSDCYASNLHIPDVQNNQPDLPVAGPRLPPQPLARISDTSGQTDASNLGPSSSPSLPESSSLLHQVQDNPALQAQSIRSNHINAISKRKREADPDDCVTSAIEATSIDQQIPGLPHSITTFNTHTNRIYSRIHLVDRKEPPKHSTSSDLDSRPRKRLRENQVLPSSSELGTPPVASLVMRESTPMDPSSHALSSNTSQAARRRLDLTAASPIKDEDVVQPLASAPLEQEATSLTTESVDIASWLSSSIKIPTTEPELTADSHLLAGYDSYHADRDGWPASWTQLYGREPNSDGGENCDSPYDPSTPGLNSLSPSETASISSSDVQTPFSLADSDYDPLPHENQAKSPSSYRVPDSVRLSSLLDWGHSPGTPKDDRFTP